MFHKIHIGFDMYVTPSDGSQGAAVTEMRTPAAARRPSPELGSQIRIVRQFTE